ncbi:hypothetical protein OS493_024292 [Desmophyllum pertusum]|uniref:DEAD/DEAH-box helicase domain-containing protein n=2 Tax=Desmophyllum pertusum TaxID=174260 RepID=A0A9W9YY90_9CNID|nr:hypothetical protein OS493_024292 [Desmophyllum pertusum]
MASKATKSANNLYDEALKTVLEGLKFLEITKLKQEQRQALFHFSKGQDTKAILPTRHGKSLIYQMAVLLAREMKLKDQPLVVVVSPLKSLIANQIRECERYGLSSCKTEAGNIDSLNKESENVDDEVAATLYFSSDKTTYTMYNDGLIHLKNVDGTEVKEIQYGISYLFSWEEGKQYKCKAQEIPAFIMAYNLRERVPRDYAALHEGQEIDDERDEFHDSFQYHPPPALPASSQDQASSTPFSGAQIIAGAHQDVDEVAALTAAIAEVTAANETLEQETEVARLKAELHALRQRNAQLQKQSKLKPSKASPQHREPQLNIKALRSNPALTDRVSTEMERLGFSSSDSDDEQNPTTRGTRDGDAAGTKIVAKTRREAAKLYGLVLHHRGKLRALGDRPCVIQVEENIPNLNGQSFRAWNAGNKIYVECFIPSRRPVWDHNLVSKVRYVRAVVVGPESVGFTITSSPQGKSLQVTQMITCLHVVMGKKMKAGNYWQQEEVGSENERLISCPICRSLYPMQEIEEHADNCSMWLLDDASEQSYDIPGVATTPSNDEVTHELTSQQQKKALVDQIATLSAQLLSTDTKGLTVRRKFIWLDLSQPWKARYSQSPHLKLFSLGSRL